MTDISSLQNYWDMLNQHDWFYAYSDDGNVYRRGERKERELRTVSNLSPEHQKLWEDFRAHKFENTGAGRPAKPERPA